MRPRLLEHVSDGVLSRVSRRTTGSIGGLTHQENLGKAGAALPEGGGGLLLASGAAPAGAPAAWAAPAERCGPAPGGGTQPCPSLTSLLRIPCARHQVAGVPPEGLTANGEVHGRLLLAAGSNGMIAFTVSPASFSSFDYACWGYRGSRHRGRDDHQVNSRNQMAFNTTRPLRTRRSRWRLPNQHAVPFLPRIVAPRREPPCHDALSTTAVVAAEPNAPPIAA